MTRILVTGARGLLGRHLLPLLESEGAEVLAPGRSALDLSRPIDPAGLPDRLDTIIHLAQSDRFRDFPDGAPDMFAVNTAATVALLDHARRSGVRQFVLASTGGVYAPSDRPIDEHAPLAEPMGFYPASKRAAELAALAYAADMNVAVLRFFFIYGAGQKQDMLVPRLVASVREGREIALQGADGLALAPIHAADAARATAAAARLAQSALVNVAGPEPLTLKAMAEAIGEHVGRAPRFARADAQGKTGLAADTARMEQLLGAATIRFADGIREMAR